MLTPDRTPLDAMAVNGQVGPPWHVDVVAETASTNADLLAVAATGVPAGRVLVAEYQSAGRGRLDRSWSSPAGAGLTFSVLLRPSPPMAAWGWLPLLTGLALARAVNSAGADSADLKWPNDLLVGPDRKKVAGILVQATAGAAVIGIGVNVSTAEDELPVPTATSLLLEGIDLGRSQLLVRFLRELDELVRRWSAAGGDAASSGLAAEYRAHCGTIGSQVAIVDDTGQRHGTALDVDADGRLLVRLVGESEVRAVAAGDVVHVRAENT